MASIEIRSPEFKKSLTVEYEEFDPSAFFEEIMPFVRTPHRLYKVCDKTVDLLIGVSHPVSMQFVFQEAKLLEDFIKKLRIYGFHLGDWAWR